MLYKFSLNGEVIFCITTSRLITNCVIAEKQEIKLDYLESLVLKVLVENSNTLISHEEFLSHWRSSESTKNSLSRVISLLRTKLKKVGLTDKVILNSPKKGYTFVAKVEVHIECKSFSNQQKELTPNGNPYYLWLIPLFFIILLAISFKSNNTNNKSIENITSIELINNTDIKLELASNSNNNFIAYSTKSYGARYWELAISDRYTSQNIYIQDSLNNRKPAWLSENMLVYRAYDETTCKIKVADINFLEGSYTSNTLFSCNPESYSSSLARYNKFKVLFSEAMLGSKASSLYIGDVTTGLIEPVHIDNKGGLGIYSITTSPESDYIVLLSSSDGVQSEIRMVDPTNSWKVVWNKKLAVINISVGWDGSLLSFKNDNGGISILHFEGENEIYRSNLPFIAPVHNVTSTNEGVLFTNGEFVKQNIAYTDLENSNNMVLTSNSNSKNKLPYFYTENLILYISNRTGIEQIWLYNLKNKTTQQVSSFRKSYNIKNIAASFSHSKIAIEFDRKTRVFELSPKNTLENNPIQIEGINPDFHDNKLIFTKFDQISFDLYSFSLIDSSLNKLKTSGGYLAKSNGKKLYYSKRHAPGIWEYQSNGDMKRVLDLPSSSYVWNVDLNNIYYQNDIGDNFTYNTTTKYTDSFDSESCKLFINFNDNKCLSVKITPSLNSIVLLNWESL